MVYVLRQQHNRVSYIKIGHSVNVPKRIKSHQSSSPVPLRLLALRNGMKKEETDLHHTLWEFRLNGEWFKDCPEVLTALDILDHAQFLKKKKSHYPLKDLECYFQSNRYVAHDYNELLESLGYSLEHFPPDVTRYGHGFYVRELAMNEIPDRVYHGVPYDGKKMIIYSDNYHEKYAKYIAENIAFVLRTSNEISE